MKRWLCVCLLFSLLCGCRPQAAVGKQVIVTGLGIGSRFEVSVQAVEALKTAGSLSEQTESATAVYTATGKTVAEALQGFLNEAGKRTYILQNKIIVLGLAYCKENSVYEALDYFMRNQEGRAPVELLVCRGDPSALLGITVGSDAIPAEYVSQMLWEGERFSRTVTAQLLDVERSLSGMYDLALPLMSVEDGTPKLQGTALFTDGRLAGVLNAEESVGLALAAGESEFCLCTLQNTSLRLENIHTAVTWENERRLAVSVSAVARIIEKNGTASGDVLALCEKQLAERIAAAVTRSVAEYGSDPLGLARRMSAQLGVAKERASALLPLATVTASVNLKKTDQGFL